jgi:hypothetical protein
MSEHFGFDLAGQGPPADDADDYDDGVFCPFSIDGFCPSTPPCPTPRQRACTGYGEDE